MIINLLRFAIKTILSRSCKTIDIKEIRIKKENKRLINKIDEIIIKAENIIFQEIYLRETKILINDLDIRRINLKNLLGLNNFNIEVKLKLTSTNLNDILSRKKWSELKSKLAFFTTHKNSIKYIRINKDMIYFYSDNKKADFELGFSLILDKNNIVLRNNMKGESIEIPIDQKIRFRSLNIMDNCISANFSTNINLHD